MASSSEVSGRRSSRARSHLYMSGTGSLERLSLRSQANVDKAKNQTHNTTPGFGTYTSDTPLVHAGSNALLLPGDSNTFLTALAAHERRVLELREELHKAEAELEKMKKQWAHLEATKKRNEIRHEEQLQPMTSSSSSVLFSGNESTRISREQDGRKAMHRGTKQPQRKVFSGSRHTRVLSLLSPNPLSLYQVPGQDHTSVTAQRDARNGIVRSTTTPDSTKANGSISVAPNATKHQHNKGVPKEAILETGKQMIGDFREGIWTFIEDLRQATVGNEAVDGLGPRHVPYPAKGRSTQLRVNSLGLCARSNAMYLPQTKAPSLPEAQFNDLVDLYLNDAGEAGVKNPACKERSNSNSDAQDVSSSSRRNTEENDDDDGWGNWDTSVAKPPSPCWSPVTSTPERIASPFTTRSSPRSSIWYACKDKAVSVS